MHLVILDTVINPSDIVLGKFCFFLLGRIDDVDEIFGGHYIVSHGSQAIWALDCFKGK